jgi:hypothetical protein
MKIIVMAVAKKNKFLMDVPFICSEGKSFLIIIFISQSFQQLCIKFHDFVYEEVNTLSVK